MLFLKQLVCVVLIMLSTYRLKVLIIDSIQENINNLCKELFFKKESITLDASSSDSSSESD